MSVTILALLLGAAVSGDRPAYDPDRCQFDTKEGALILTAATAPKVAAGGTVKLDPRFTTNPGDMSEVPHKCLSGWKVSDTKLAKLSRDGKSFVVAAGAREGASFTVSASYRGKRIEQKYEVIVPVSSKLVGFWTQETVKACTDANRIYDLVLSRTGEFGVSFGPPMHNRKDYRGKWRVEGDRLILSDVTGDRPADFASEARFSIAADGGLAFDKPWYGTQGERGKCAAPFVILK